MRRASGAPAGVFCLLLTLLALSQSPVPGLDLPAPGSPENLTPCPRCGYRCDAGWHYCPACGWDLKVLAGAEGAEKLQAIGASMVGLILVKEPPSLDEILPPELYRIARRYSFNLGRKKEFATAFPFLKPGIFVTTARALEWVEVVDVRTYRNKMVPAQILGYDIPSGIGVVQAEVAGAVPLAGSQVTPREADLSWAICFPVALTSGRVDYLPESFHRGRISATGLEGTNLVAFEGLLRTDHTLEEGCYGGALLDRYGAAAGMVLDDPDPGINYALPVADLKAIVEVLSDKKRPQRPFFGIGLVAPDDRRRAKFHLPAESTLPLIAYVIPGSPAEKAGVQPGDLLTAVTGEKVVSVAGAGARLLKAKPEGGPVSLTLQRQGKETSISISPGLRPRRVLLSPSDEFQETVQANLVEVSTGATSQQGLRLTDLVRGGRGEKDGYHEGDLIVSVDNKGVRKLETFDDIVRDSNTHIFVPKGAAVDDNPHPSTYRLLLGVKPAQGGEKDQRAYLNFFPDVLTAPIY